MPKRRDEHAPYWQQLRVAEKGIIEYALEHGKTIRGTAVILGISPNYLGERLRLLGIPVPDVRPGPKPGTKRPQAPKLRVVPESAPAEETQDADEDEDEDETTTEVEDDAESDVLEEETEEGSDDDEGDPWDDEDEDEDDSDDEGEDANAQGN